MNTLLLAITLATNTIGLTNMPRCLAPGPPKAELARALAVFSGKVVGRDYIVEETSPGEIAQRLVIKIAVERVWKGDVSTEVTLYTSEIHLFNGFTRIYAEDFKFDDDKQYLVYGFGKPDRLSTDGCTRTRELSKADADLKELGDGHVPKPAVDESFATTPNNSLDRSGGSVFCNLIGAAKVA